MAQASRRGLGPTGQGLMALSGCRRDGLSQPGVKRVRHRAKARVAIAPHVVKTHAAAHNQDTLIPQRGQRLAGTQVGLGIQIAGQ